MHAYVQCIYIVYIIQSILKYLKIYTIIRARSESCYLALIINNPVSQLSVMAL